MARWLIFTAILFSIGTANASCWIVVGLDGMDLLDASMALTADSINPTMPEDATIVAYDGCSISKESGHIKAWTNYAYGKHRSTDSAYGVVNYTTERALEIFLCKERQIASKQRIYYFNSEPVSNINIKKPEPVDVIPDTAGETLLNKICKTEIINIKKNK